MDVGIREDKFIAFRKIFEVTANSIGLKTGRNGEYIYISAKDIKHLLERLDHQTIDVDERIRGMLSSGPYR